MKKSRKKEKKNSYKKGTQTNKQQKKNLHVYVNLIL